MRELWKLGRAVNQFPASMRGSASMLMGRSGANGSAIVPGAVVGITAGAARLGFETSRRFALATGAGREH